MATERRPTVSISSSLVTSDGCQVAAAFTGPVSTKFDTGIQVIVPPGQLCQFVPSSKKIRPVILKHNPDPQSLVLRSKGGSLLYLRAGKPLGNLYFLTLAPFPKIEWTQ